MRKCLFVVLIVVGALAVAGYQKLDDSQKRFVQELGRQVPYLVPRYFV